VVCNFALQDQSELQREMAREVGIEVVLPDLEFGVRALAHLQRWSEGLLAGSPPQPSEAEAAAHPSGERETLEHLAAHGVPVIPAVLAHSPAEAARAAETFGGRVVLKVASPDIAHKTEAGGVRLDLAAGEAADAYDQIVRACRIHAPDARLAGVIVSPMRGGGVELIVGVARDPDWGPALVVGLGGVFAEALKDSQARLLPVTRTEVRDMLEGLRGVALLKGFRGAPPADLDRLCAIIAAIGDAALALGPGLAALEVNPLLVRGAEIECLDGLAVFSSDSP
jgi:acyl-CoA synthetase (NDP forming)